MGSSEQAVLTTMLSIGKKYKKGYCWPSQKRLLELLREYHKIVISRRELNRVLKGLEEGGYFERIRRHREGLGGRIVFASTLYRFRQKLFTWAYSLKKWASEIFSHYRVPNWAQYKPKPKSVYGSYKVFGFKGLEDDDEKR